MIVAKCIHSQPAEKIKILPALVVVEVAAVAAHSQKGQTLVSWNQPAFFELCNLFVIHLRSYDSRSHAFTFDDGPQQRVLRVGRNDIDFMDAMPKGSGAGEQFWNHSIADGSFVNHASYVFCPHERQQVSIGVPHAARFREIEEP